jgi:hypothetical protein
LRAFVAFLVAASTCGATGIRADHDQSFVVGVHLQIDQSIASGVLLAALEGETESLWSPYGVHLHWTAGRTAEAPSDLSLDAILERSIDSSLRGSKRGAALGLAFLEQGAAERIQPIRVFFDATESALALRPITGVSTVRIVHEREMARALGRVLAHEIGHVLLGAPDHDGAGLMRAVFRPFELADSNRAPFRLTDMSVARLDHRLRQLRGIAP